MAKIPNPGTVAALIREVAAAEILPRFQSLNDKEINRKAFGELVTDADEQAEKALSRGLRGLMSGSLVVGEEGTAKDPSLLARLGGRDPVWIIDPVDGTYNFARGCEPFVIIVALDLDGETVMGWIYEPRTDRMAVAERGSGARLDGHIMSVASGKRLEEMTGFVSTKFFAVEFRDRAQRLSNQIAARNHKHCIGAEYIELAKGQVDMVATGRLYPWDHAAGVLIHAEAGGHSGMLDGRSYASTIHDGVLILAPDMKCWTEIAQAFKF